MKDNDESDGMRRRAWNECGWVLLCSVLILLPQWEAPRGGNLVPSQKASYLKEIQIWGATSPRRDYEKDTIKKEITQWP